jgi:hypothetical protein
MLTVGSQCRYDTDCCHGDCEKASGYFKVVYAEAVDEQGGDGLVVLQAPDDTDLCTDELARDTELALDEASCIALGLYSEQGHTLTTTHGRVNLNAETPCFVADTGGPDDDAAPGTGPVINALNGRLLGIISNNNSIGTCVGVGCVGVIPHVKIQFQSRCPTSIACCRS